MDFKNIDKKYRPFSMWSWNEKLNTTKTSTQAGIINNAGFGGFFVNARAGLQTPYMGEEWFRNISCAVDEAQKESMQSWICDENGSPSGFGNGVVNSNGLDFQQKYLRMEAGEKTNDRTIICVNGYHFYYDVNPYYVDTLNKNAVKCFIEEIYEKYYDKLNNSFDGFLTREVQISKNGIPWSFTLPAEYKKMYGEELLDHLEELFRPVGNYEDTRIKFYYLITTLFSQNYVKQIFDWCNERSIKFSGNLVYCDTQKDRITSSGTPLPHYRYMHMPSIICRGKKEVNPVDVLGISSVSHQFGKKEIASESYCAFGHNVDFDDLKRVFELQAVRGITRLCCQAQSYSLRGLRKRDYPPCLFFQNPTWDEFKIFNDTVSRISMLLSEGKAKFDTLLISNTTSAWAQFNGEEIYGEDYASELNEAIDTLEKKHIPFHIGDEIIIEQHARVEDGAIVIGTQKYKSIVLPKHKTLLPSTVRILNEFERAGGFITLCDSIKGNDICSNENLLYTTREFDDFTMHYFVNNSYEEFTCEITKGTKMLDVQTGEILPFYGVYKFIKNASLIVIEDSTPPLSRPFKKPLKELDLSGEWDLVSISENALLLDKCDIYFDGELIKEKENVCDAIHLALKRKDKTEIRCEFEFNITTVPDNVFLICETPEMFEIKVNDKPFEIVDSGYFKDPALRKLLIKDYLCEGINKISLTTTLNPSQKMLSDIEKAKKFATERNKLTYITEIEPIYIVGEFCITTDGPWHKLDKGACRYLGDFSIDSLVTFLNPNNIEKQGFPFFSGKMTLKKLFNLSDTTYALKLNKKGISSIEVLVNGNKVKTAIFSPYVFDLSEHLVKGDNIIEITLKTNLRNMLGPHHIPIGESSNVGPNHFVRQSCVRPEGEETPWEENYCLTELGFENIKRADG